MSETLTLQSPACGVRRAGGASGTVSPVPWLQRLAAWADRQPPHRRLGAWTASIVDRGPGVTQAG